MTHKKVFNPDVIMAIPEGKRCLTWFTSFQSEHVCFLLELDEKNNIAVVNRIQTGIMDDLAIELGTIFYGTLFQPNIPLYNRCFCVEDIYYYKNKNVHHNPYNLKLEMLKNIFRNEISQFALNTQFVIFGLPFLSIDFNTLLNAIPKLPYKVSKIKHRFFDKQNARKIVSMNYFMPRVAINNNQNTLVKNNNISQVIFKVCADVEPDIYHLYALQDKEEIYYDVAFISDYKTSVMMNNLFRKIKENHNLDAVEESDDEEEFENTSENKYVYLDRVYKFNCVYNAKFKRWCPVSLAKEDDQIVSMSFIKTLTKKY
jgi:hypothetical protein